MQVWKPSPELRRVRALVLICAALLLAIGSSCDGQRQSRPDDLVLETSSDVPEPDADTELGETQDSDEADQTTTLPPLDTHDPIAVPVDSLQGKGVESCRVYQEERCVAGARQICKLYDTVTESFVVTPDPTLERVYLYDRWYDLYHQPWGMTAERVFVSETLPGTPESEWGSLDHFERYDGEGDAAIWTGSALHSAAMRYVASGTEADYQRMEDKTRALVRLFEVTGVPGYLARFHYLRLEPGAPKTDRFPTSTSAGGYKDRAFAPTSVEGLPPEYTQGLVGPNGTVWHGTPMFHAAPSIDQYSGPRLAFPLVYGLLRDEALKAKIALHMTCYLKRLERIEIINLQKNPDALAAIQSYFGGGGLQLDPGDIDLMKTDTIVAYGLRQLNTLSEADFDYSCPAALAMQPTRVLDASQSDFLLQMVIFAGDLQAPSKELENGIDHLYVPSIRGGDALALMHLAIMAYHFTGDEQYRRFLFDELIGNIDTIGVAKTTGAFAMPRWCNAFYGHHITFSPVWSLLTLLPDSPLRRDVEEAVEDELWQKLMSQAFNAKFNVIYAGEVRDSIASSKAVAIAEAVAALRTLGGNGGVLNDPRREYDLDRQSVIDRLPAGNSTLCPTDAQRALCEDGFEFMGATFPGTPITSACVDAPGECPLGDDCALAQAARGLPMDLREYADFLWQRNPFAMGHSVSVDGYKQSPGLDLTEVYWLARYYGFIADGAGQVLAWEANQGSCP